MTEYRRDELTDRVVILAAGRSARPHDVSGGIGVLPEVAAFDADCPFCPGNEAQTPPEVARFGDGAPDTPGWRVRVVPNKFPILEPHEVIVLSPAHDRSFGRLDDEGATAVFRMLHHRAAQHLGEGRAFVQTLVNHGAAAGASLTHPHAQLLALDEIPPAVNRSMEMIDRAGADIVSLELAGAGDRTVARGAATAWCPSASGAPYTVRVAHRSTRARLEEATDAELGVVAVATRDVLARIATLLGDVPYNLVVHSAPAGRAGNFHWYVEVTPRISNVAGFEMGTGILVNTVPPEDAAAALRDVELPG